MANEVLTAPCPSRTRLTPMIHPPPSAQPRDQQLEAPTFRLLTKGNCGGLDEVMVVRRHCTRATWHGPVSSRHFDRSIRRRRKLRRGLRWRGLSWSVISYCSALLADVNSRGLRGFTLSKRACRTRAVVVVDRGGGCCRRTKVWCGVSGCLFALVQY